MSISLTIYDVFGNLVPGLLYLYVINEVLIALHLRAIDINQLDKGYNLILAGAAAYVLGHMFNTISHEWWFKLFFRDSVKENALKSTKKHFKSRAAGFEVNDFLSLLQILRNPKPDVVHSIEILGANSILMRNISLGLAMYVTFHLVLIIFEPANWLSHIFLGALGAALSAAALYAAKNYRKWYYQGGFSEGVLFGSSLAEATETVRRLTASTQGKGSAAEREAREPEAEALLE